MPQSTIETDLLVIGGGINGVGIAADAAGRGLRVTLCEMFDLASGTSSASSSLIHGGLRYLEQYDFDLVFKSLAERANLMRNAPHLVQPIPFILPHCPGLRSKWLIRLGLLLYDYIQLNNKLPTSAYLNANAMQSLGLQKQFRQGFKYYDCKTNDSRLVLHVALLAKQHGANILLRTKVINAKPTKHGWQVIVKDKQSNQQKIILTKAIVNATGPWLEKVAEEILAIPLQYSLNLSKGSHIIVPRLVNHDNAFILQHRDKRVIFVVPYQHNFHLIGTTEISLSELPKTLTVSVEEEQYLYNICNAFFEKQINSEDIVYKFAGIRALYTKLNLNNNHNNNPIGNHTKQVYLTRDYVIDTYLHEQKFPIFSLFGGKLTTYRDLAEQVVNKLSPYLPKLGNPWTKNAVLPGGEFAEGNIKQFCHNFANKYHWLPHTLLTHLLDNYGSRAAAVLGDAKSLADLGKYFGGNLYQREVEFLIEYEWARTTKDILWRRTKHGLLLTIAQHKAFAEYLGG